MMNILFFFSFLIFVPVNAAKAPQDPCKIASDVANAAKQPIINKDFKFAKQDELNLHGKRVKRAKEMITSFLEQAKSLKKKFVLVITGKGKHSKKTCKLTDGTEVGPVKYSVLSWLQSDAFSQLVKKFSYAHGVHGGEGALYIELNL